MIFISWLQLHTAGHGHKRPVACRKARTPIFGVCCSLGTLALLTESVHGQDRFRLASQEDILLAGGNLSYLAGERCFNTGGSAIDVCHCCPWFYHQCARAACHGSAWVWVRMSSGQPKVQMSPDKFLQINASLGGAVAHTRATNNTALQLGFLNLFKNSFNPCPEVLPFFFFYYIYFSWNNCRVTLLRNVLEVGSNKVFFCLQASELGNLTLMMLSQTHESACQVLLYIAGKAACAFSRSPLPPVCHLRSLHQSL